MKKIGRTPAQLEIEALEMIRKVDQCELVFSVGIRPTDKEPHGSDFVLDRLTPGQADVGVAGSAMVEVQRRLRERYFLVDAIETPSVLDADLDAS